MAGRTLCPIRFAFWVDVQDDFANFLPVRASGLVMVAMTVAISRRS
jgi:hypothetical protein